MYTVLDKVVELRSFQGCVKQFVSTNTDDIHMVIDNQIPIIFPFVPFTSDTSQGWISWICNLIVVFLVYICTFLLFPVTGWFVLKVTKNSLFFTAPSQSLCIKSKRVCVQTVPNYQRIVVFRLGRVCPPKGPGIVLVLPLIDQWQRVDLRTRAFNIPPCQVHRNT